MVYEKDKEKAELFASVLTDTFTDACSSSDFDRNFHSYVEEFVAKFDYGDNSFDKVSFDELVEIIKGLREDSSPGEDDIHNRFLKNLSFKGIEHVLNIINLSLVYGVPESWKQATINMIPKLESYTDNYLEYRPINLLSCLSKVAERVIKNRLYLVVREHTGFRNNRGTWDNLLFMTQKIEESFSTSKKVCGLNFDISKAFYKVWHAGIIYKLILLNIPK